MIRSIALLVVAALAMPAAAQETPLVRFGAIADPQYAPAPPRGSRYYANSLAKLSEAVDALNEEELDFVVTLGDIIDRHVEAYNHILPIYQRVETDNWFVLGNHEYDVHRDYVQTVPDYLGMDARYYSFTENGVRFITLDGNDLSMYATPQDTPRFEEAETMFNALVEAEAVNAQTWNGGISQEQFDWLTTELDAAVAADELVVIFCHFPAAPEDIHNLWNYEALQEVLSGYDNVMAYFNGHNHAGHYAVVDGVHYVTVEGMLETANSTAYAIIEVYEDRVVMNGFGRASDRELAHAIQ
ncbi:MAG: metallophosphoesterase [Pseudomonadota bacterium]